MLWMVGALNAKVGHLGVSVCYCRDGGQGEGLICCIQTEERSSGRVSKGDKLFDADGPGSF
jgi:hypothetical protein